MLDQRYQKTDAGRAEIKSRALVSSRVARNLLLVIDAGKTAREWLGLVQGASEADFALLFQHGLISLHGGIAAVPVPAPAAVAASSSVFTTVAAAAAPTPVTSTEGAGAGAGSAPQLDYAELYAYLTRHAKQYLGLIKGYKVVLEVERCGSLAELQAYALRFVEMVREAQGDELARQVQRAMGIKA
ncbi:hypothetical protein RQP53_16565 [Paucibacter sp. APW11]|uniref:Proline-rich protein n=1 Tax=Roseateles aquae TaxID=3077235 RepID=A0ABU3PE50_9BURK|nr:hypothetical protein [Paucibacter sp. APW11]MDT9000891.1 hypothetical protein [Paucibacter sp. APW11]